MKIGVTPKMINTAIVKYLYSCYDKNEIQFSYQTALQSFQNAYEMCPDYRILYDYLNSCGVDELCDTVKLFPGIPSNPMLVDSGKNLKDFSDQNEIDKYLIEYKFDGQRIWINYNANQSLLKIF